ncbi:MAG: adenylate/guanylate cyclase domain-containing protein [Calditrichaceae bacterium]|nr:adenylate/guanylate cyclase domain-containing protein [Calditrichaceae bacterium]
MCALFKKSKRKISEPAVELIKQSAPNTKIADGFRKVFSELPENEVWSLQPYDLADRWETEARETLESFILGCSNGLFELHWIHQCPQCKGMTGRHEKIAAIQSKGHCPLCNIDFMTSLDETVEVTFSASPQHYKYSADIADKYKKEMAGIIKERGAFNPDAIRVTGKDCINVPLFRDLFGHDLLAADQSLNIKQLAILFTDIKSSTEIYRKYGDVRAYNAVRRHFDILFESIEKCGGVVIKTIGDSVMATFVHAQDGLCAALESMKKFPFMDSIEELTLDVKFGLHTGPCIAVNLNDWMDVFGSTVNMAARIQGTAKEGELVVSEEVFKFRECKEVIAKYVKQVNKRTVMLKGIDEGITVYTIKLKQAE